MAERQPRERPVPCWMCGWTTGRNGAIEPRRLTFNLNRLCDEHQPTNKETSDG